MSGVVPADILNLEVTGSRRRLKSEPASESARLLQAGSTATATATYTVAPVSVYSASQLRNELTNSVTSGAFTTDLNDNAATNGNSDLVGASSNSFPSDDKKKTLSTGAIVGIAIGCFAFVVLVIVISWCLCCRKRNDGCKYCLDLVRIIQILRLSNFHFLFQILSKKATSASAEIPQVHLPVF